jgi:CDP-diacylglycerol---glycerol-3-phosphate 3-phosphatidyltransferase
MTVANRLTILRLVLTLPFVAALSLPFAGAKLLAFALFLFSSLTDLADGYIARRFNQITDFGKLMDPLVDKIMTMSAFVCLVSLGNIPAWAVIIILSREFLVTGLRMIAASRNIVLPAERLGKHKTTWQMVTICYWLLLVPVLDQFGRLLATPIVATLNMVGLGMVLFTVALTLWSGAAYFAKNRHLVSDL